MQPTQQSQSVCRPMRQLPWLLLSIAIGSHLYKYILVVQLVGLYRNSFILATISQHKTPLI